MFGEAYREKLFEVLKVAYKRPIHVMNLRCEFMAVRCSKQRNVLPFHLRPAICAFVFCIFRQPQRSQAYSSHLLFRRKQESIVEPIVAPEHLGPDEKGRRTKDALGTSLLRLVAEPGLDKFGLSQLCKTQGR